LNGDLQSKNRIELKGSANKLKVIIPEDLSEAQVWESLEETFQTASNLLKGVDLVIDLQGRQAAKTFLLKFLTDFVLSREIRISSWESSNEETRSMFSSLGMNLSAKRSGPASRRGRRSETLVIRSSLRSGQRIEHEGDVLVIGHINDGAELIAEGNIMVMGKLKGLVHAGYNSDEARAIITLSYEAKQVRLGARVSTLTEDADFWGKHVIVTPGKSSLLFNELKI
jgi:septum site-determining protein MinC